MALLLVFDSQGLLLFMLVISIRTKFYYDFFLNILGGNFMTFSMTSVQFCYFHGQISYYFTYNVVLPLFALIETLLIVFLFVLCYIMFG